MGRRKSPTAPYGQAFPAVTSVAHRIGALRRQDTHRLTLYIGFQLGSHHFSRSL
jgi:hypothetical protein